MLVARRRIAAVGRNIAGADGASVIDADGRVVAPGLIDLHVHLREPGREDVETIATGALAAAAGGFTGSLRDAEHRSGDRQPGGGRASSSARRMRAAQGARLPDRRRHRWASGGSSWRSSARWSGRGPSR